MLTERQLAEKKEQIQKLRNEITELERETEIYKPVVFTTNNFDISAFRDIHLACFEGPIITNETEIQLTFISKEYQGDVFRMNRFKKGFKITIEPILEKE